MSNMHTARASVPPGLPLGTKAPIMTPNGEDFSFLFFLSHGKLLVEILRYRYQQKENSIHQLVCGHISGFVANAVVPIVNQH